MKANKHDRKDNLLQECLGFPLFHFFTSDICILKKLEEEPLYYIYYI